MVTTPELIARAYEKSLKLKIYETPVPMPDFQTNLVWHERNDTDPGITWLRELIVRIVEREVKERTQQLP